MPDSKTPSPSHPADQRLLTNLVATAKDTRFPSCVRIFSYLLVRQWLREVVSDAPPINLPLAFGEAQQEFS